MQPVERVHGVVVDLDDDVSRSEPDILRKAAWIDSRDNHAALSLHPEMPRSLGAQGFDMQAELQGRPLLRRRVVLPAGIPREHLIAQLNRDTGVHLLPVSDIADLHLAAYLR